jgi:penicillin amidase/acyl-homoserine-lactone acylase
VKQDRSVFVPPEGKYEVTILRDTYGIPHVFGETDVDAAYGLAWAHCEDDWENMEGNILTARGDMARFHGRDFAPFDYLARLCRVRQFVNEGYHTLSPELIALVEAYAEGINHFAAAFPGKMPHLHLPVTGQDIVAGTVFKAPFFYEMHVHLRGLLEKGGDVPIGASGSLGAARDPGSNAWAVAPHRTPDGATRLAINSHQPWTGPVAWYEAHLHSNEGWNMSGGTFPGGPMIFSGFDGNKGWCHTVNRPDLVDIYHLEINPQNENQYRHDGEWRDFEREEATFPVKLWGDIRIPVTRELLWSVHGPALRTATGVYAVAFAGYGEIGHLEQWFRMNKARNLEEFMDAMRMQRLPSFNTVYADREGQIFYLYNGQFPVRAAGHDWRGILPGDDPALVWRDRVPFEQLPQVLNPPSGFLQSCNNTPFHTTNGEGNPDPQDFPVEMGIERQMTNRALRALALYGTEEHLDEAAFRALKFDKTYAEESLMAEWQRAVAEAPTPDDPLLAEAQALITGWNRVCDPENEAAALAILGGTAYNLKPYYEVERNDPMECLAEAATHMHRHHGRLSVPLGEVLRLIRGDVDLPLGGGPDCLRAIDPVRMEDGRLRAEAGDCLFYFVTWDAAGGVSAAGVHQFGAATADADSPHYADQSPLFSREAVRPVWRMEAEIRANLARAYRPGGSDFLLPLP